ncbi:MAG TPA: efflux RND transporter periplasmic adaptor subunit [Candidatus Eisenbacteria bacterium]|nr:efflux RND transporter periplasmic adaptor subunit [Candidatus Eisenbacteria bacterium]
MNTKSEWRDPLWPESKPTSTAALSASNRRVFSSYFSCPAQLLCALLLLSVALAGCSSKGEKPAPPPPGVTVTPVVKKDVEIRQEWVGTMAGNIDADIRPKVEGFLLTRLYSEGSFVEKGQALFQLDKRQAQAAVEQATGDLERAKAALSQAEIDVRRYTPLVAQRAVSQAELDKSLSLQRAATASVEANQAGLDNARLNLGWTSVTSPIAGIAGVSKVGIGDLITPNTVMTTVSNVNPIYVDVNVAEQEYLRFRRGGAEKAKNLELILGDGTIFPQRGRVLFVNREVDTRTGTIQVRGEFPNPGNVLRPGQYARVRAVTEVRKDALLIPQQSVAELQGIYQVAVVGSDNKVTIKTVKLGPQFHDMWVVESGLAAGENVIVDGLQRVKTGVTVAPAPFKDTQANALPGDK